MIYRDNIGQPVEVAVGRVNANFRGFVAESNYERVARREMDSSFTVKVEFLLSRKKGEALKPYQCSLWTRAPSYCVRGSFASAG